MRATESLAQPLIAPATNAAPSPSNSSVNSVTTRSRARRTPQQASTHHPTPPTGSTLSSRAALSCLINLFSGPSSQKSNSGPQPNNPNDDDGASLSSEVSSLSESSQLNPEARPFVLDSIREEEPPASPSNSTDDALHGDAFAAAFGRPGENVEEECHRLERNRRQALAQGLEESYEHVPGTSTLTKHLWSHYKELPHFATSLELYAHARKNITVEILFTAPLIFSRNHIGLRTVGCAWQKNNTSF